MPVDAIDDLEIRLATRNHPGLWRSDRCYADLGGRTFVEGRLALGHGWSCPALERRQWLNPGISSSNFYKALTMSNLVPNNSSSIPWPLTFDAFSFGASCYNTLASNVIFMNHQFALVIDGPSGEPRSPEWKDRWTAGFIVMADEMPPDPVELRWTSLDGVEHYAEIDLIKDIFPEQVVLHNVSKEDVNEDWARYEGGKTNPPQILMEVNDRTINIYLKAMVLTKLPPNPKRPDIVGCHDLVLAWTKTS
ncbi:hypothetical protein [Lysobacter sp. Hz 25]|uniref:hypothetical protein n=1 Tax=Lysobacter sp. Hz 25 TaxID=3383698 RepID=UPI0038D3DFE1